MFQRKYSNKNHKNLRLREQHHMYWSTEDQHYHYQQNYCNKFQNVQHQTGIQQVAATVLPQQQQYHTPPPPIQQQHQQSSLRRVQQNQSHYPTNQQHPQHQHKQWPTRPPILNAPPFIQQFRTALSSSMQFCSAPPPFFHPQGGTQTAGISAPPQQRSCLPPGCATYPMPQQATALRQNVIPQPPPAIIKPTKSSTQQMQMQYFPTSQYCQPPPLVQPTYGNVIAPPVAETIVVKHRKHAIPIIDPRTKENIFERELQKIEPISPADVTLSTKTTSSSTLTNLKDENYVLQTETTTEKELPKQEKHEEEDKENNGVAKENTPDPDSSVQLPKKVDDVESIESKGEVKELNINDNRRDDDADPTQSISTTTIIAKDIEPKCNGDENKDKNTFTAEGNLSSSTGDIETPLTALKDEVVTTVNKQQQTEKQPQSQPELTKNPPTKKCKRNKRLRENQKKQKADVPINKITDQKEHKVKQTMTDPCSSNRQTATAKKYTNKKNRNVKIEGEKAVQVAYGGSSYDVMETSTPRTLVDHSKCTKDSDKTDDPTETSEIKDDNDHLSQLCGSSSKFTKSEQITSDFLGIDSTDDSELLFLNSSVSGYEEDICSSPSQVTLEKDKENDIHFGDFSQEKPFQEISAQKGDESEDEKEDDNGDDAFPSNTREEVMELAYTLQELKSYANVPASKIPPPISQKVYDIIGKNLKERRGGASAHVQPTYQQYQMYQQISYKDSLNYLNRKRNKRANDVPPYQQQYEQQQRKPDIICINLSLNEEIELAKSENPWVPAALQNRPAKVESEDDEQILKKIRGILNKLTPENFDKLLQSAGNIPMTGEERINKLMLLIFEKTVREPNFAPTYARFCKFIFNPLNQNYKMFKTILIKRIQEEFESNVNNAKAKNAKLRPIMDRLAAVTDSKEKLEIKAELDDQEFQFRRRAWGTVRFIGEMFKLGFLVRERVCTCVENLLDPCCEEKLEYMCKLLATVGAQLEPLEKQLTSREQSMISERLSKTFVTIKHLVEKKKSTGQKISSRVRFMMQDVLESRARLWDQKGAPTLPSREVSPALTCAPPSSQREMRMSSNYMPSDGYEKRKQSGDRQKNTSQLNIDVSKLPVFSTVDKTRQLGNSSLLMWQTVGRAQQQQQSTQQNNSPLNRSSQSIIKEFTIPQQVELSRCECERLLNGLIEVVIEEESKREWFAKWKEIAPDHHRTIIYHLLTEYLPSAKVKLPEIEACARLFINLLQENLLTRSSFNDGYQKFSDIWDDILVDVPKGWQYVFNFLGPLLHLELIPFDFIWDKSWRNTPGGDKFLQSMIVHFTSEFGANYMRYYWEYNSLSWDKFIAEERVAPFIVNNRFEFIENDKSVPPIFIQRSPDDLVQRIKTLLSQCDQNIDLIIDFIDTNVHINRNFIQNLTVFLCDYTVAYCNTPNISSRSTISKKSKVTDSPPSISTTSSSYKLRKDLFLSKCIPLLRFCVGSKDEYELSCLDAIVYRCKQLYDSSAENLICSILSELYGEVISKGSFEKWLQQLQLCDEKLRDDLSTFLKNLLI